MESRFGQIDTSRIQILAIAGSVILLFGIFEMLRRRKLREEYSFIWITSVLVLLFFSIFRGAFDYIAHALGVAYSPALLILVILLFGMLMLIHFSIIISRLTGENKALSQELAIQGEKLRQMEKK